MTLSLLELINMTPQLMQQRLDLLDLTEQDLALGQLLQDEVIRPNAPRIIEAFYAKLLTQPQAINALKRYDLEKVKVTQLAYLLNLGIGFNTVAYFEERLSIGITHVRANIHPALYQCAYRVLQQLLIDLLPIWHKRYTELLKFIIKITALDMSLAIESYEKGMTEDLQRALMSLEQEKSHLKNQVLTDTLTGVLSRKGILDVLESKINHLAQHRYAIAVLMVDIDHFKQINDVHGHLVGDVVLKGVAQRMRSALRNINALGRYGGEEFLIALSNTNMAEARLVGERMREKVAAQPFSVDHAHIAITVSVGAACFTQNDTLLSLIERADLALYQAKRQGRNCVVVAGVE